jgi:hypothetical protein
MLCPPRLRKTNVCLSPSDWPPLKSSTALRFVVHAVFAVSMLGSAYTGRNYVLLREAYPPILEALRPPAKDRIVGAIQSQLPASGAGQAASGFVASLASERNTYFQSWEQEMKLREEFARNELVFWVTALILAAGSLLLLDRQAKNVP